MLQYIVKSDNAEEIISEVSQALEGGCRWIEIKSSGELSDEELKKVVEEVLPIVKNHESTLTLASRVALAKETGVDGVQLYEDNLPPDAARMELEAGPIIGMSVKNLESVERNMNFDIDYFRVETVFDVDGDKLNMVRDIARFLNEKRSDKPLAAAGGLTVDNIDDVLSAGADGMAIDSSIAVNGKNVKDAVEEMIEHLEKR